MVDGVHVIAGSSPRARGTRGRATPTSAPSPVHPRLRGEHSLQARTISPSSGSSPPARGTRFDCHVNDLIERFIPACAGNTAAYRPDGYRPAVHPRLRGEHASRSSMAGGSSGSSPRARGTLVDDHQTVLASSVHPRLRGEHRIISGAVCEIGRFIPACAGNTSAISRSPTPRSVHPRLRGEHELILVNSYKDHGSSPPARGTPRRRMGDVLAVRFIPACAGNTPTRQTPSAPTPVHPRLRGEHTSPISTETGKFGSSPPARGTLLLECIVIQSKFTAQRTHRGLYYVRGRRHAPLVGRWSRTSTAGGRRPRRRNDIAVIRGGSTSGRSRTSVPGPRHM